jgi:hypothetical protein
MEYGRIIRRALGITWRHKVLWVFGVAAVVFGGGAGGGGHAAGRWNGLQYTFGRGDLGRLPRAMPFGLRPPMGPGAWPGNPVLAWQGAVAVVLGALAIILVLGLLVGLVSLVVRYTSLGALSSMVNEIEETEKTSFRSGLRRGWARMLRLVAIDLLIGVATLVAVLALVAFAVAGAAIAFGPAIGLSGMGSGAKALSVLWGVALGIGFLAVFILLIVALTAAVSLVREFAFRACVIDGMGVFQALDASMRLVRRRLREAALMWLLLLGINLLVGLVTIPLALGGIGGLLAPALLIFGMSRSLPAALLAATPFLLLIVPVSLLVGGVYLTFQSAVWTLTYRELRGQLSAVEAV